MNPITYIRDWLNARKAAELRTQASEIRRTMVENLRGHYTLQALQLQASDSLAAYTAAKTEGLLTPPALQALRDHADHSAYGATDYIICGVADRLTRQYIEGIERRLEEARVRLEAESDEDIVKRWVKPRRS